MISIITITAGRPLYLRRLINSIYAFGGAELSPSGYVEEHVIVAQGDKNDPEDLKLFEKSGLRTRIIFSSTVKSVGRVLHEVLPLLSGDLVFKLDDDAVLRSPDFFESVHNISEKIPGAVFSPFPVGLINNPGGPQGIGRNVIYSEADDTYYTLRKVKHVGGFARIAPRKHLLNTRFSDGHSEDVEFSTNCNAHDIPMYYLENGIVVEHQETTLGQQARYGAEYFQARVRGAGKA